MQSNVLVTHLIWLMAKFRRVLGLDPSMRKLKAKLKFRLYYKCTQEILES